MKEAGNESPETVKRLCNEIQLFDLCDRQSCTYKAGRFCTNQELLARFERISEDDRRPIVPSFPGEEPDEDMEADFDDGLELDSLDDEGDEWEDE